MSDELVSAALARQDKVLETINDNVAELLTLQRVHGDSLIRQDERIKALEKTNGAVERLVEWQQNLQGRFWAAGVVWVAVSAVGAILFGSYVQGQAASSRAILEAQIQAALSRAGDRRPSSPTP